MKFWQLLTIFRDEEDKLEKAFKSTESHEYLDLFLNRKELILKNNRSKLDTIISYPILKLICINSNKRIYFSSFKKTLYSYKSGFADSMIPIVEAIDLFDHDSIEEVFEKSESYVL